MGQIGVGEDLQENEEFWAKLEECRLFEIRYPRGGQYNDGFELNGHLFRQTPAELLTLLNDLGIEYTLHDEMPVLEKNKFGIPMNSCHPINTESGFKWLELNGWQRVLGHEAHVSVWPSGLEIKINLNSLSWFCVALEDVERAIELEANMQKLGIVSFDARTT